MFFLNYYISSPYHSGRNVFKTCLGIHFLIHTSSIAETIQFWIFVLLPPPLVLKSSEVNQTYKLKRRSQIIPPSCNPPCFLFINLGEKCLTRAGAQYGSLVNTAGPALVSPKPTKQSIKMTQAGIDGKTTQGCWGVCLPLWNVHLVLILKSAHSAISYFCKVIHEKL